MRSRKSAGLTGAEIPASEMDKGYAYCDRCPAKFRLKDTKAIIRHQRDVHGRKFK
jgi:hypothetical protein